MRALTLYDAGYESLVSVIPPGATLSPLSKIKPEDVGKAPGRRNGNGQYGGYDWRRTPTRADVERWARDKNNIGLAARDFPAIDIDCLTKETSMYLARHALARFGNAPVRIGRWPKMLLVFQTASAFGRMRLWFKRPGEEREHLIEVLGDGQQYVIEGMHPSAGKPYHFMAGRELPSMPDLLPVLTRDAADAWLEDVADDLDAMGYMVRREGHGTLTDARGKIDQTHLLGSVERIREATALIPNTNDTHPGRDDYLRMGYAIKAGCGPDHEDEALEIFQEWAARWEGNDAFDCNDPEEVERDFHKMIPPYEVGAEFLFDTAKGYGFSNAADDFEADMEAGEKLPSEEPEHAEDAPISFTDAAVAAAMAREHHGTLRYCKRLGGWMSWRGTKWENEDDGNALRLAGEMCRKEAWRAIREIPEVKKAERVAERLNSNGAKNAAADYARTMRSFVAGPESFDADPLLLNTQNGIVDLRTGVRRAHDPARLMTKVTGAPVGEGAPTRWLRFLDETTGGDRELVAYLQRLAGYCLTGETVEAVLAFVYGPGGNGKSVFLNTLEAILADYFTSAPMDAFTESRNDRHPAELAQMNGKRLVTATETEAGKRWNESRIKQLTGGDTIMARFMGEDWFAFKPQFKLVMAGNHKPEIRNVDDAIRRRLHLVPFVRKPETVDRDLPRKLRAEYPQILAWMIEGALEWQRIGLQPPESVRAATEGYLEDEDSVGQWVAARVEVSETAFTPLGDLFADCAQWCGQNGVGRPNRRTLAEALEKKGFTRHKRSVTGFLGLALKAADEFKADLP